MNKLAVLVSRTGTNLRAMHAYGLEIALVVADRTCPGLTFAREQNIPCILLERTDFSSSFDRYAYTKNLTHLVRQHNITLIAMAGFATILDTPLFDAYPGKILNTHPSLLPAFKGASAVRDALAYGVKVTGCTIHIATLALDSGPILAQHPVLVHESDTEASLHQRIKEAEYRLYPAIIANMLCS